MPIEADAQQAREIWMLVAEEGYTPDEATRKVLGVRPVVPAVTVEVADKPKKKLNQMPAGKKRLGMWLEDRAEVIEEYRFHPTRKWRFDWYLPEHKIAVEYEGFLAMGANAAHSAVTGIMRDVEKYNEAQAMGIRVFRAHAENIRTGAFLKLMDNVLGD